MIFFFSFFFLSIRSTGCEPGQEPHIFWFLQLQRLAASDKDLTEYLGLCPCHNNLPH